MSRICVTDFSRVLLCAIDRNQPLQNDQLLPVHLLLYTMAAGKTTHKPLLYFQIWYRFPDTCRIFHQHSSKIAGGRRCKHLSFISVFWSTLVSIPQWSTCACEKDHIINAWRIKTKYPVQWICFCSHAPEHTAVRAIFFRCLMWAGAWIPVTVLAAPWNTIFVVQIGLIVYGLRF